MKTISIAFAINDGYIKPLSIALYSLLQNNKSTSIDVYVLCRSLKIRNKRLLCDLQDAYANVRITVIELGDEAERFNSLKLNIPHISIETYYRYILADILPKLDSIIYLDADILVTGDIQKLSNTKLGDYYVAGVRDMFIENIEEDGISYKDSIGLKEHDVYINAGVLLMNLKKFRKDKIVQKLFNETIQLQGKIKFQDQDVLNIILRGNIKELSDIYNYTDYSKLINKESIDDIAIIHYNGPAKPWDNVNFADFQKAFVDIYHSYADQYHKRFYGSKNKFALYTYSTENIGDDIQSVAARRFLPRIDYYIDRDSVGAWQNNRQTDTVKLIANGWYMHSPHLWPIADRTLDPLYVSMYIEQSSPAVTRAFESPASVEALRSSLTPIGARDRNTLRYLERNTIDSYMSGCLTLTLQKDNRIKKQDFILLTDVSKEVYNRVKSRTDRPVVYLTNASVAKGVSPEQRLDLAEIYLYLYQSAHCVITERLHTALPCLALETPVLLITKNDPAGGNEARFEGLDTLLRCISEESYLVSGGFDTEAPPENPKGYLKYRKSLIDSCTSHTSYINNESFAWSDIPELSLREVLSRLEYINATNLKVAATNAVTNNYELNELKKIINENEAEIKIMKAEATRLLSVRGSAKRLLGNLRRLGRKMTK